MPFSTFGPMCSRLLYGRGTRSWRLQCFLVAVMLLPLGLLFFYAITEPASSGPGSSDSLFSDGSSRVRSGRNGFQLEKQSPPTRDQLLDNLVLAKSIRNNNPIPDTRPNDCIASSSEDSPPALEQIRDRIPSLRTTIVLVPDQKHATIADYHLTLASILTTTEAFYERMEVALVVNEFLTNDVIKFLEKVKDSKMPVFFMVKPKKTRKTLFHELIELGDQLRGDILVYVSSGMECNSGWLEAMIMGLEKPAPLPDTTPSPVVKSPSPSHEIVRQLQPVIVVPHFDRLRTLSDGDKRYEPETEFVRLLFHWSLKPMWYEMSFEELLHRNSEAEEIAAPVFLPHAFAVNKSSPLYAKLFAYVNKRASDDTTSLEAALMVWRCLNGAVVIAPCARIGSPNAYLQGEFDPRMTTDGEKSMKKRIVETWFEDYRPTALRLILDPSERIITDKIEGQIDENNLPPEDCSRSFHWYLENIAKDVIIPEEHIAFGWMKSGGGACFRAAIEHRLLGGSCTILSDAHVFFLEKDGSIRTRTGLCLSAPDQLSYIEIVECDPKDTKQHWIYGGDSTIKSAIKDRCVMHATDPDEEKKSRQILMLYNCKEQADKDYAPFQKFSFTYKIV